MIEIEKNKSFNLFLVKIKRYLEMPDLRYIVLFQSISS